MIVSGVTSSLTMISAKVGSPPVADPLTARFRPSEPRRVRRRPKSKTPAGSRILWLSLGGRWLRARRRRLSRQPGNTPTSKTAKVKIPSPTPRRDRRLPERGESVRAAVNSEPRARMIRIACAVVAPFGYDGTAPRGDMPKARNMAPMSLGHIPMTEDARVRVCRERRCVENVSVEPR